ncbi:MAG TPA: coenzyme F420-0:L-glutamate ligase [Anaerolineae bacterium]|nr:coenzyme F420-0:L-glutamate ligase [Anaerolineae bacterium]
MTARVNPISLLPVADIPLIQPGADLPHILIDAVTPLEPVPGDVLVIAQKIVSKAENRYVDLATVTPSPRALELAALTQKDPRLIEVILWDSREVVRVRPGLIIVEHRLGWVCANAGVDRSNVAPEDQEMVLRLPADPDASAARVRAKLCEHFDIAIGVIIADSHGRPHRAGTIGVAIGVAGLPALEDWRGRKDLFGYTLQHTEVGLADQIASAATLLLGQAAEAIPAALVRGVPFERREGVARDLLRPREMDLFR